jgi:hypothetical protein
MVKFQDKVNIGKNNLQSTMFEFLVYINSEQNPIKLFKFYHEFKGLEQMIRNQAAIQSVFFNEDTYKFGSVPGNPLLPNVEFSTIPQLNDNSLNNTT